ncbi:MAG: hypothetical protein IKT56_06810 [Clostridia bacterium]|nr:hypothetical protein [Clostridia bacterium]
MKKIVVLISILLLILLLVGCNSTKPNSNNIPPNADTDMYTTTDKDIEETIPQETTADEENLTQSFKDTYHKAEWVYSLFTKYGKLTYTENEIFYNNERYQEVMMDEFDTLDELRSLCLLYFNQNVTKVLMGTWAKTDCPLYIEQDGKIYRFSGYTAPYAYNAPYHYTFDLQTDSKGQNYANIYATMDSNGQQLPCHTYCVYEIGENGEIVFIRFDLMAQSFFEQYRVTEISPELEPLTNGGVWTCVAIYGENGNTGSGWGGKIQASEDGIVYFVFGSTRGKYDNSIEQYVTFKVTIENGSIVSCEETENIIADFLNGSASVYKGDVFVQENVKIMTKARYTTDRSNAYMFVYTIQIEGNEISIYAYADGTDMGGQYTGTFEYDRENGEMVLHLTLHYFSDDNGPNEKDIGEVRGKLYESNGLVAFVCTDAGEAAIDEGMPLIFVKD